MEQSAGPFSTCILEALMTEQRGYPCPICRAIVPRQVEKMRTHFRDVHQLERSAGEVFQMFTKSMSPLSPAFMPEEGAARNWTEVSGGLPSLPRRK